MILSDVISDARVLLQDTGVVSQRFSDEVLLGFANQTLKRIAVLRPDLFAYVGEIPCVSNSVIQSMPSDSARLMEIFSVKDGGGVRETNRQVLDDTYPEWVSDTAGPCVNWMRHPRNNNKFFVYPKAPSGQTLIGEYAQTPPDYALSDEVALLPDAYYPVVLDGVVFLAESMDNEHVTSGRAALFQKQFTDALAVNLQSKPTSDLESAGLDDKEQYR